MTDHPPINPEIGELFRLYRKKKINPTTGKAWTLQELSDTISILIQAQHNEGSDEGLSPSAISRLENGSLLPGRSKLKILANFLEIPENELKPIIDLGESSAPMLQAGEIKDQGRVKELESKLQKSPLDWLKLVSAANMAGLYYKTLSWAEDGLLAIENSQLNTAYQSVLRALTQSKKAYAQFCLEDEENYLQRSFDWARNADISLNQLQLDQAADLAYLRIETVRTVTTASLELFNSRYLLQPRFESIEKEKLIQSYSELLEIFERFEEVLQLARLNISEVEHQFLLELYLYYLREKDRLGFKWLEIMEQQALWESVRDHFHLTQTYQSFQIDSLALLVLERLKKSPKDTLKYLRELYVFESGQIWFTPARELQTQWQVLSQSMLHTLEQHDQLDAPNPNKAYQEAVMLYPITAARLGQFDRFVDLGYFKLIYMQTTAQTRPIWYYVRACCYALAWRQHQKIDLLDKSLQNWSRYCFADKDSGTCNLELFSQFLGEVALWSAWLPLFSESALRKKLPLGDWFYNSLKQLLNQSRFKKQLGRFD